MAVDAKQCLQQLGLNTPRITAALECRGNPLFLLAPLLPFRRDSSQALVRSRLLAPAFGLEPIHRLRHPRATRFSAFTAVSSTLVLIRQQKQVVFK